MSTSVSTSTVTRTQTATHLSDVIYSTIAEILTTLGVSTSRMYADWAQDTQAISAWIFEGSLKMVVLECTLPSGKSGPIYEFPVSYEAVGVGDRTLTQRSALINKYSTKLGPLPSGTTYRLVCTFNGARSSQPGWNSTTRTSTAGMQTRSLGTLASAPHGSASSIVYWSN